MRQKRMNAKFLRSSLTLAVLIIGLGVSVLAFKVINPRSLLFSRLTVRTSQATLGKPTPLPFFLVARDEQKKECFLLGICDDKK